MFLKVLTSLEGCAYICRLIITSDFTQACEVLRVENRRPKHSKIWIENNIWDKLFPMSEDLVELRSKCVWAETTSWQYLNAEGSSFWLWLLANRRQNVRRVIEIKADVIVNSFRSIKPVKTSLCYVSNDFRDFQIYARVRHKGLSYLWWSFTWTIWYLFDIDASEKLGSPRARLLS